MLLLTAKKQSFIIEVMFNCSLLIHQDDEVNYNKREAAKYFKMAAGQSDVEAMKEFFGQQERKCKEISISFIIMN